MKLVPTTYGTIPVYSVLENDENGRVLCCLPGEKCTLDTPLGALTPQYTADDLRKKEVLPVVFHPDGTLKSLPLETQTMITTPAGPVAAELVTFHENGAVSRVFPLNGKLSGYWGQEDEAGLATLVTLDTPAGRLSARIIGVSFFDTGELRSLTLWPGESVSVQTPAGPMQVRNGISFHPGGAVRSVEPAKPTPVKTSIGEITAYDSDAVGVTGDVNSLCFDQQGRLDQVITTLSRVVTTDADGAVHVFAPQERESLCGDEEKEITPMILLFTSDTVSIRQHPEQPGVTLPLTNSIQAQPYLPQLGRPLGDLRCSI